MIQTGWRLDDNWFWDHNKVPGHPSCAPLHLKRKWMHRMLFSFRRGNNQQNFWIEQFQPHTVFSEGGLGCCLSNCGRRLAVPTLVCGNLLYLIQPSLHDGNLQMVACRVLLLIVCDVLNWQCYVNKAQVRSILARARTWSHTTSTPGCACLGMGIAYDSGACWNADVVWKAAEHAYALVQAALALSERSFLLRWIWDCARFRF